MDRRTFLKSLFAAGSLVSLDIEKGMEQLLIETSKMSDDAFITYITYLMEFHIDNPRQCGIITNIGEK